MNRKYLIGLMAAAAATAALCGCVSAPTPQPRADMRQQATAELGITRNAWSGCVRAAIPPLDDPQSSSDVVARAAMKRCSDEYTAMVRALTRTLAPACGRDPDCTRRALATAQGEATKVATDDVVAARVRVAGATILKCQ
ncbi:MAG TPA: hypothetical protein VIY90_19030 [Steroidobacteraceae bacterium]